MPKAGEGGGLIGTIRDQLIGRTQDRAREGRLLTGRHGVRGVDRLPPGRRPVRDWRVLDRGIRHDAPRVTVRPIVDGAVETRWFWTGTG